MNDKFSNFKVPYSPAKQFSTRVAYFSMEFALDQSLKTFSGGLGFLAGSHMRSLRIKTKHDWNRDSLEVRLL